MVKLLSAAAPAKINLFLRVTGRRADGYHELDSIFLPISLADRIGLALREGGGPAVYLRSDSDGLGPDDQNLAVRAARAFMAEYGIDAVVAIDLRKRIPPGAGLGGGSSDAAAVLRMLAELFRVEDGPRLRKIALRLGADVLFFLDPRPARVRGIGERIEPLDSFAALAMVLAMPPIAVATAAVFRALEPAHWSGPAADTVIAALGAGRIEPALLVNDLAAAASAAYPLIGQLQQGLVAAGARAAAMTGSGGATFGIFSTLAAAEAAAAELRAQFPSVSFAAVTTADRDFSGPARLARSTPSA